MHNHSGRLCSVISLLVLSLISRQVSAETYDECLARLVQQGETTMTLGQIRSQCQPVPNTRAAENPIGQRIEDERETMDNRFSITPHRPNYLLPLSYNKSPNHAPFENSSNDDFSNTEIKFQLSLKAPLVLGLFKGYGDIYVAYTNTSWWQAYNDNSAPFRETNHEPEIFLALPTRYQLSGFELNTVMLGLSHQSNGRSGRISRSRNRLYANFIFSKGAFVASLKPWWRIPESEKEPGRENDSQGDDNPDIHQYLGYGELHFGYRLGEHNLGMMIRNNLDGDNRGAVQLDWSFPINQRFRGYIQYFNGYGESLIDYNDSANRLSLGIMLTDWL